MIKRAINFITVDIWRVKMDGLPKSRSIVIRQLQILIIAFRGFNEDKCLLRASALTFYSLLSIVPVVAMLFGVAKGFGFEKMLNEKIMSIEGYNYDVLIKVAEFAQSMLANTKGGVVAGLGVAILFWSVMKILGNIESSFNDIWEIKKQRSLARKFSDYLSIMLVAPILFILSTSITGYVSQLIDMIFIKFETIRFFRPFVALLLRFIPYLLIWLLLGFIYMVMPNTKVRVQSAIVAGVIAGTMFVVAEVVYFYFQLGVGKYNAIYGSFAALPLFLVWMQTSWMIVLFGAEISFANQNVSRYEFEADSKGINQRYRKELSMFIMYQIIKRFEKGELPLSASNMAKEFSVPIRLLRMLLNDLLAAKLIVELNYDGNNEEVTFQPAKDINKLTFYEILNELDHSGNDTIPIQGQGDLEKIRKIYKSLDSEIMSSKQNFLLKDI